MIIPGKEIRVFDNGGITNDRYTIIIDGCVFGMNSVPFHPTYGFSQFCGDKFEWNESWGQELDDISELPQDTVKAIIARFE